MTVTNSNEVCPNCGSANVRWRRRRAYDVVLTCLRWFVDSVAGKAFGATRAIGVPGPYTERESEVIARATRYAAERKAYEERLGAMTASRFWKCADCRRKGQVFEKLDGVLEERGRLVEMQNEMAERLSVIGHPIEDTERRSD